MPTEQTLFFACPHCNERFARVEEPGQRHPHRGDLPLRLLRHPGDLPGRVRRGLRAATQGAEGLLLLPARALQLRTIHLDRNLDTQKGEVT